MLRGRSLETVLQEYVHQSGRITTPSSKESVTGTVRSLVKAHPLKRVNELTEQDLVTWIYGAAAPNSQRRRKTAVAGLFEWAHWKGYLETNPAQHLKYSCPIRGGGVREHTWLTETEMAKVVATCDDSFLGRRDQCILLFGFLTGLRLIELTRLTWDSIHRDGTSVLVMRKGRKLTAVGLPSRLQHGLSQWQETVSSVRSPGATWHTTGLLQWKETCTTLTSAGGALPLFPQAHSQWTTWDGDRSERVLWDRALGDQGIQQVVRKAGKAAGFPTLAPHDMRRSYAGLLEEKGFPIVDISRMLGHANVAVTQRYLNNSPHRTTQLASTLEVDL